MHDLDYNNWERDIEVCNCNCRYYSAASALTAAIDAAPAAVLVGSAVGQQVLALRNAPLVSDLELEYKPTHHA